MVHPERDFAEEFLAKSLVHAGFTPEVVDDLDDALRVIRDRRGELRFVMTFHHETTLPEYGRDFRAQSLVNEAVGGSPRIPVLLVTAMPSPDRDALLANPEREVHNLVMPFDSLIDPSGSALRFSDRFPSLQDVLERIGYTFESVPVSAQK